MSPDHITAGAYNWRNGTVFFIHTLPCPRQSDGDFVSSLILFGSHVTEDTPQLINFCTLSMHCFIIYNWWLPLSVEVDKRLVHTRVHRSGHARRGTRSFAAFSGSWASGNILLKFLNNVEIDYQDLAMKNPRKSHSKCCTKNHALSFPTRRKWQT